MCKLCVGELSEPLPIPVLEEVDVKVDWAVERGQQVADAGHVGEPGWPVHLSLVKQYQLLNISCLIFFWPYFAWPLPAPRYWEPTSQHGKQWTLKHKGTERVRINC